MAKKNEPLSPPVIAGARDVYDNNDDINLRCKPENFPRLVQPPPSPGTCRPPARREYVDQYAEPTGLTLRIPASQVSVNGGSSVEAECVVKLGAHELRSSTTLRVRPRPSSYLSNYFSAAGMAVLPTSPLQVLSLVLLACLNS
ncbi:uncharacterized protein LOC121876436 [Homarus americanus]|uniref:uncharacterized protein LOC121876436 n=1 Tax=Homarus americanus TaxID=6706 RepID=UPI001C44636C|nr:uncharacterized protein LOC121876436 [Homarus americanus]